MCFLIALKKVDAGNEMRLLVLSGGFGTRLKAVVSSVPKALAPIGNVPFLRLQMEHWIKQGLSEFTFLLHHQADQIISFLQSQQLSLLKDCKVDWVIESVPMDTGGAIAHTVKNLGLIDDFLVVNSDTWLESGVYELIKSQAPSVGVVNFVDVSRYGQINFDQSGCVTEFIEKNTQQTSGWINAGFYHLTPNLFEGWEGQPFSLERDLFPTLIKNRGLKVVPLDTTFIDIGVPEDYHRFCLWVESGCKAKLCN